MWHGCSLGLERLGLETVSRRFFERLGQGLVLETLKSRSRLLTSRLHRTSSNRGL